MFTDKMSIEKTNRDRIGCETRIRTELEGNEVAIFVDGYYDGTIDEGKIKCSKETAAVIAEMLSRLL